MARLDSCVSSVAAITILLFPSLELLGNRAIRIRASIEGRIQSPDYAYDYP